MLFRIMILMSKDRGLVNGSIEMEFCQKKILQMSVSQQINIALFSVSLYCRSVSSGLRAPREHRARKASPRPSGVEGSRDRWCDAPEASPRTALSFPHAPRSQTDRTLPAFFGHYKC